MAVRAEEDILRKAHLLARGAASFAFLSGALTLVGGWVLGLKPLRSWVEGLPSMPPHSALALMLLAVALWLRSRREAGRRQRLLAATCAGLVTVLGLATLAEYTLSADLGMDRLLPFPGRPPPNSAACFTLLGLALLTMDRPTRPWTDFLVIPALLTALVAFNGYLHGALVLADMPRFPHSTGMSLPVSLSMLVLGIGILCARPERGLMARVTRTTLGGFFARLVLPMLLLLPPLVGALLELFRVLGPLKATEENALFSTLASASGIFIALFCAGALNRLDAERLRATEVLAATGARLQGLLDAAPDPVVTVDRQGMVRSVNCRVEHLFGYTREELVGQPVAALLPEQAWFTKYLTAPDLLPSAAPLELRGRRKDGTALPLEVTLGPFESPEGWVLIVSLRDITERKRAEAERELWLSQTQSARAEAETERVLLRAVLNHTPVGVLFVESATDRVLGNPALEALLGQPLSPEYGRQQYLALVRHPDGRPVEMEELPSSRVLEGQKVETEEYVVVRPDGSRTPVLLNAAPVNGPSGELRGVVLTLQDISARKELERLKEEYVGLISHDLRTPLHTISLRLDLLLRQLRAHGLEQERATAETIQRSVARMGGMISELLEGTRLESGRVELDRAPMDLGQLLAEVLERDVPPSERERFRLECPAAVRLVLADEERLTRVVVNLLTNALKYSPPGSPVEVRLAYEESQALVGVTDRGPGLQPMEAAKLFQKYYRTRSTAKQSEGLGLGLYISRLIVEAHGGRIWVESSPGQGARFCFTLPLAPPAMKKPSEKCTRLVPERA